MGQRLNFEVFLLNLVVFSLELGILGFELLVIAFTLLKQRLNHSSRLCLSSMIEIQLIKFGKTFHACCYTLENL